MSTRPGTTSILHQSYSLLSTCLPTYFYDAPPMALVKLSHRILLPNCFQPHHERLPTGLYRTWSRGKRNSFRFLQAGVMNMSRVREHQNYFTKPYYSRRLSAAWYDIFRSAH